MYDPFKPRMLDAGQIEHADKHREDRQSNHHAQPVLAQPGGVLEPGNIMLSGSFIRPVWAEKGDTLHADFGPLGSVAVQFV